MFCLQTLFLKVDKKKNNPGLVVWIETICCRKGGIIK